MNKIIATLLLFVCHSINAQNILESTITFYDTIMIGEPMFFDVNLHNKSHKKVAVFYDPQGYNYNNLERDNSFEIKVYDSNNELIPNKISTRNSIVVYSRRVGFQELSMGYSLAYTHWIESWINIDKPGTYSIEVSKDYSTKIGKSRKQSIKSSAISSFEVIAFDSTIFNNKLETIFEKIQTDKTDNRAKQLKRLCKTNNRSVIPYLENLITNSTRSSDIISAMRGLSSFNTDEEVFNIISKPFAFDTSRWLSITKQKFIDSQQSRIKHFSINNLSEFSDDLFIPFALKHKNDNQYAIRLTIMKQLYLRRSDRALEIIKEYLNDENQTIVSEAKMYLGIIINWNLQKQLFRL